MIVIYIIPAKIEAVGLENANFVYVIVIHVISTKIKAAGPRTLIFVILLLISQ
jgi:hypothetical protein